MQLTIFPPVEPDRLARIHAAAGPMEVINAADEPAARAAIIAADAFFGKLTPELLQSAQRLQWVQTPTASLEHYVFPELVAHPCVLTNMRGLFSDVIADHVLGFVICLARNLHRYMRRQLEGRWEALGGEAARSNFVSGPGTVSDVDRAHRHLADCSLGIVGVGSIGAEIARRAGAFGMQLYGVDPQVRSVPGVLPEVWPPERLPELLGASDFVVVAAPQTPATTGLFRRAQFEQMRRDAFFINIGRGAIVSLDDLTAALREGLIAGAALDVFEIEPLPADHPLWRMENVIITPHVAAASPRIAERHTAVLLDNIRRFVAGQPLTNVVDKANWF